MLLKSLILRRVLPGSQLYSDWNQFMINTIHIIFLIFGRNNGEFIGYNSLRNFYGLQLYCR